MFIRMSVVFHVFRITPARERSAFLAEGHGFNH